MGTAKRDQAIGVFSALGYSTLEIVFHRGNHQFLGDKDLFRSTVSIKSFTVPEESDRMLTLVRRILAWGVVLALLLPVVLILLLGLGNLLGGMGDGAGQSLCLRLGLMIGLGWVASIVTTAVAGGVLLLETSSAEDPRSGLPNSKIEQT